MLNNIIVQLILLKPLNTYKYEVENVKLHVKITEFCLVGVLQSYLLIGDTHELSWGPYEFEILEF